MENFKLILFEQMLNCCHNFYFWEYTDNMQLISSTCNEPEALNQCFQICFSPESVAEDLCSVETPIIVGSPMQMLWISIPYHPEHRRIYVLGPFFVGDVTDKNLDLILVRKGLSKTLRNKILSVFQNLPVISWNLMINYTIMMFNCITNNCISQKDIRFFNQIDPDIPINTLKKGNYTIHGTYQAEQKMLKMVKDGNLDVLDYLNTVSNIGEIGTLSNNNLLRQMQNATEVSITLFSRAAIEGGLSPELSYNLADYYFQAVESCLSISELIPVTNAMHRDFVERVHKCKTQQYSKPVTECCDYIMMHLEENISIADLAAHTGYTNYYCSKKFKSETGMTPAQYIRKARLDAAANLLKTSNEEIQEIASRYKFGSQSYFTDSFRQQFGCSPRDYRTCVDQ